jgi:hypothetical protein
MTIHLTNYRTATAKLLTRWQGFGIHKYRTCTHYCFAWLWITVDAKPSNEGS